MNPEACYSGLKEIIKLRAVQAFSPHKALSFIFGLKSIIREELEKDKIFEDLVNELTEFEKKLDSLIGLSFDIYTECRDKIHEIRLAESKSQSQIAFKILNRRKSEA